MWTTRARAVSAQPLHALPSCRLVVHSAGSQRNHAPVWAWRPRWCSGERHGVYVPLVFDLEASTLTWLDVCSEGRLALNNVERSKAAITPIYTQTEQNFIVDGVVVHNLTEFRLLRSGLHRGHILSLYASRTDTPEGSAARAAIRAFILGVVQASDEPFDPADVPPP